MNDERLFKDTIYEQLARIGKAVSSPKRLELIDILSQSSRPVETLASLADLSVANVSQHLKALKSARLVESEKVGVQVFYRLASPSVAAFIRELRLLGEERLAEIDQLVREYRTDTTRFDPVDRDELLRRVRRGEAVVLDVRPEEEYRHAHVAGALSVPLRELEARIKDLPADREIVAYCRGAYCLMAVDAVEKLRARNFRAFRLDLGVTDWQALGFALESGSATP
ncbi:MAG: metalloregulator ArsR/SmtB family transcription factor [Candidatus Hydrogenedentes bacterium]|nr:metalloregulator ArsR/SmtB family transcription factor [Candidatus Hydrogenedentota bacterium]